MTLILARNRLRSTVETGGNDAFTRLLLRCDGVDGSTTFTDVSVGGAHGPATVSGNAQVDTAESVFGGGSLLCGGSGDWLSYPSHADWNLGSPGGGNDFTIDFRFRPNALSGGIYALIGANPANAGWQVYADGGSLKVNFGPATEQTVATAFSNGAWYHIAIVRSGTTTTVYRDGTSIGTCTDVDWNNDAGALRVGSEGTTSLNGWLDEVRISKGIARWISNFAPPTAPYS